MEKALSAIINIYYRRMTFANCESRECSDEHKAHLDDNKNCSKSRAERIVKRHNTFCRRRLSLINSESLRIVTRATITQIAQ